MPAADGRARYRRLKLNLKLTAALVGLIAVITALLLLPVREWLMVGLAWIDSHRTVAWIVYILGYVLATTLALPGSIITIGAGFLFGLPLGTAIVSAGSVIGATCAFLIGRFLVRDWVAERAAKMPRFRALDEATGRDGFLIVLLARLSPLFPFNLLNYGLGLTAVRLADFVLASWIGMLPGTILYVYIGTLAQDLTMLTAEPLNGGLFGTGLLVIGFVATLILTIVVTRRATAALKRQLKAASSSGGDLTEQET
jgi:uncharacterized membrane protein YdjX (TVP38/TMEM64 family)